MKKSVIGLVAAGAVLISCGAGVGTVAPAARSDFGETLSEVRFRKVTVMSQFDSVRAVDVKGAKNAEIKLAIGSAMADLVRKQIVTIACGKEEISNAEFGATGGTLAATTSAFPSTLRITYVVDFLPETNLPSFVRVFDRKLDEAGTIGIIQVFCDETTLFVDRGFFGQHGDYLLGTVSIRKSEQEPAALITRPLSAISAGRFVARDAQFAYFADDAAHSIRFEVSGRLKGCVPAVLGSTSNRDLKAAILMSTIWNCTTGRPEFVAKSGE